MKFIGGGGGGGGKTLDTGLVMSHAHMMRTCDINFV